MEEVTDISRPKVGAMGPTGTWREFRPVMDLDRCTKCLRCWVHCPEGCITRHQDDSVEIDYEYCKGCGVCEVECRPGAITMVRED